MSIVLDSFVTTHSPHRLLETVYERWLSELVLVFAPEGLGSSVRIVEERITASLKLVSFVFSVSDIKVGLSPVSGKRTVSRY